MAEILDVTANELLAGDESSAEETRPTITTGKADGRDSLLTPQRAAAAFGRCRSLHHAIRDTLRRIEVVSALIIHYEQSGSEHNSSTIMLTRIKISVELRIMNVIQNVTELLANFYQGIKQF